MEKKLVNNLEIGSRGFNIYFNANTLNLLLELHFQLFEEVVFYKEEIIIKTNFICISL